MRSTGIFLCLVAATSASYLTKHPRSNKTTLETLYEMITGISSVDPLVKCPVTIFFEGNYINSNFIRNVWAETGNSILLTDLSFLTDLTSHRNDTIPKYRQQALRMDRFLKKIYEIHACYTIIIWIEDWVNVLEYFVQNNMMAGWRHSDFTLVVIPELERKTFKYTFWREIPNVAGVSYSNGFRDPPAYTILPFTLKIFPLSGSLISNERFRIGKWGIFNKYKNMMGYTIPITLFLHEPFVAVHYADEPYIEGIDWRLLMWCAKRQNFTVSYQTVEKVGFYDKEKKIWGGSLRTIQNGESKLVIGGVVLTSERMKSFDFSTDLQETEYSFISPRKPLFNKEFEIVSFSFEPVVWKITLLTIIFTLLMIKAVASFEKLIYEKFRDGKYPEDHFIHLSNSFIFCFTVIFLRSYTHRPKTLAVGWVYHAFLLAVTLMGWVYSSFLFAALMQPLKYEGLETIDDILKSSYSAIIGDCDNLLNQHIDQSTSPELADLRKRMIHVNCNDIEDHYEDVIHKKMVLFDNMSSMLFHIWRHVDHSGVRFHMPKSGVRIMDKLYLGLPMRKNWFMKRFIDSYIQTLKENFVYQHDVHSYYTGEGERRLQAQNMSAEAFNETLSNFKQYYINHLGKPEMFTPISKERFRNVLICLLAGFWIAAIQLVLEISILILSLVLKFVLKFPEVSLLALTAVGNFRKLCHKTLTQANLRPFRSPDKSNSAVPKATSFELVFTE